jgi:hypothetical protein
MKSILIRIPDAMKTKLDLKRLEGYSLNGYISAVLERALAQDPPPRVIFHRKRPGRR